jgi:ADP-ribose pyrophosphatase YjhB (NUDIX family)
VTSAELAVRRIRDGTGRRAPDGLAVRGHVLVTLDDGRVLFLREVRDGSVTYAAPGISAVGGETPGHTAHRAALEHLGIEVHIAELVFADTENGAEHFYFLATPLRSFDPVLEPTQLTSERSVAALSRSALLAYPIRPTGIALRLRTPPVRRA